MNAYNIVKQIGKGSFSNVYLCKNDKITSSLLLFNGIYDDNDIEDEFFIVKEINMDNLVKKCVKKSNHMTSKYKLKKVCETTSISITPYNNNKLQLELKMQKINNEEDYYYKRFNDLIKSEIEVLKEIDNANVIKYMSSTITNNIFCIKMEYCECGDLFDILKNNSNDFTLRNIFNGFDNTFVTSYLKDTINGLKYLHDLNIIHRDIKLHNILVKKNGNNFIFKLSDFGFACYDLECDLNDSLIDFDFNTSALHKNYFKICGTPYYMAPEIILNKFVQHNQIKFYDKKVDLWSYGICLYELIFNTLPYSNIKNIHDLDTYFLIPTIQSDIYKNIDTKNSDVIAPKIKTLLKRLLTINPTLRISAQDTFNEIMNVKIFETESQQNFQNSQYTSELPFTLDKSWIIEDVIDKSLLNSWDKINKASSLIMKISVDQTFMTWLLNKK